MGRRKRDETLHDEEQVRLPAHVKREKRAPDAYPVLRGPAPHPDQELLPPTNHLLTGKVAEEAFERYCEELASSGDVVKAVAAGHGISEQQARADLVNLEKRIVEAAPDASLEALLKRYRASEPIRIAKLGALLHHDNPAVVLKSEERLSEIQGSAGNRRQGVKAEDLIRLALQKIAEKNKKPKAS